MNKYYTPEIEEFCVGFRYEMYLPGTGNDYASKIFENKLNIQKMYNDDLQGGWLRVKHLDQEDIEELGWGYLTKEVGARVLAMYYRKGDYFLLHDLYKSVQVIKLDDYSNPTDIFKHGVAVFVGEIKNYNELKKLMNQLGI